MIRRILVTAGVLLSLSLAAGSVALGLAHRQISRITPQLPSPASILAGFPESNLPLRLSYINTASQPCPRSMVLEDSLDPGPPAAYVMSHTAFVLEWADGSIFLIDTGMSIDDATAFGKTMQRFGAGPLQAHGSVSEQLGAAAEWVAGVGFTHLHPDHTSGLVSLCTHNPHPPTVYQTPLQSRLGNYTTRAGRHHLQQARCAPTEVLSEGPRFELPEFPGLVVLEGAGHTPGSSIFVARVGRAQNSKYWVFAGDVVNHIDGVRLDIPKPFLYSRFVVPESSARLSRLRRLLAEFGNNDNVGLLISHDLLQIRAAGIKPYSPSPIG